MNCDIKTSAEAWNHGIESFEKAFLLSGNTTKSIRYALKEVNEKYPELKFDPQSFANPLVEKLKEKNIVKENYNFKGNKQTDVDKIVSKFKGLDEAQAKTMSKKIFEKSFKNGMVNEQDVKNAYAEMKGLPSITPEFVELIDKVATDKQAYEEVEKKIKSILGEIQSLKKNDKYSKEKDAEFSKQITALSKEKNDALENYLQSDLKFGEMLAEKRHWVYQFGDIMKMNLMTPVSLLKNTTGMVGDAIFRNLSNLVSAPISFAVLGARKALGKTDANWASPSVGSRTVGSFKGSALKKAKFYAKYGTEPVYTDKLRIPNYIDGVRNMRKAMEGEDKFFNYLAATFKISPTFITRGLGSPDFFFQEMAENAELNRIGNEKGLTGAELQGFLLSPDEESLNQAREYGKNITYKKDLPLEEFMRTKLDFAEIGNQLIAKGGNPFLVRLGTGVGHIMKNIVMPFTKTPINILRSANRIVLPEYTLIRGLYEASKMKDGNEKTHKIISSVSDATVGFHIRMIALNMVAQGLISAGYDDEEQKAKEIVEKKAGGSNRVNVNAVWRGLTFQDIKEQKGDTYVDINALGTLGIALGAYAHAYNKYGKEDLQKEVDYLKDGNFLKIPAKSGLSQLSSALDFTFFSGWNEAARAIRDESGYALDKYVQNSMMTVIGGVLPSTHQLLSKASIEDRNKTYDKDLSFSQNVFNQLGYRFAFSSFGEPTKNFNVLTPEGEKANKIKEHYLFDNYWGRLLASVDPFKSKIVDNPDTPVYKLYSEMHGVEKKERDDIMPAFVEDKFKINGNEVKLDKEQYEYFQQQTSLHRMMLAAPFIMSQDFDGLDYKGKCKVLQSLYREGRSQALEELKAKYPKLNDEEMEGGQPEETELTDVIEKYKNPE